MIGWEIMGKSMIMKFQQNGLLHATFGSVMEHKVTTQFEVCPTNPNLINVSNNIWVVEWMCVLWDYYINFEKVTNFLNILCYGRNTYSSCKYNHK